MSVRSYRIRRDSSEKGRSIAVATRRNRPPPGRRRGDLPPYRVTLDVAPVNVLSIRTAGGWGKPARLSSLPLSLHRTSIRGGNPAGQGRRR